MNAREELHESMCGSCYGKFKRGECESVDRLIDAYAHELAEKIRERARRIGESGASATGRHAEDMATRGRAWHTAADLIDPEVQR